MRRAWTAQTILTVLLAFVGAPLLHVHMAEQHGNDGLPAHAHETIVHAHFAESGLAPDATGHHDAELSHASHDAKRLEVFTLAPDDASLLAMPFLAAARIELIPATLATDRVSSQFSVRGHDPPLIDATGPRAPPA